MDGTDEMQKLMNRQMDEAWGGPGASQDRVAGNIRRSAHISGLREALEMAGDNPWFADLVAAIRSRIEELEKEK